MKKAGEDFEPARIIQILQDVVLVEKKGEPKSEKAYGDGVIAKYKGNFVTLKIDNRKIPSNLMKKIEALLESELGAEKVNQNLDKLENLIKNKNNATYPPAICWGDRFITMPIQMVWCFQNGQSSLITRLMKNVTRPSTSTSSNAEPSIASPSLVISASPMSFANCVWPSHRINNTSPGVFSWLVQ